MYRRIMSMGAPPREAAKYDGDHNMFFQYLLAISGRSLRSSRLDTPLRLFTKFDTATLGGQFTNRGT